METLQKPSLFWDVDRGGLDPRKYADFIIGRILDKGDMADFVWAVDFYGKDLFMAIFQKNVEKLNAKSNNFWCVYFNLDKSQCIRKQSIKKQSPFWQR